MGIIQYQYGEHCVLIFNNISISLSRFTPFLENLSPNSVCNECIIRFPDFQVPQPMG